MCSFSEFFFLVFFSEFFLVGKDLDSMVSFGGFGFFCCEKQLILFYGTLLQMMQCEKQGHLMRLVWLVFGCFQK